MNDHVCNINCLVLIVGCSCGVGELEKFFDGVKYGCDRVSRMVCHLLDNFLTPEDFLRHQLTVVFLGVIEHVRHVDVDGVGVAVLYIRKIRLLGCGDDFLHKGLLESRHFAKMRTSLVCVICVFEFAWVFVTSGIISGTRCVR